VKTGIYVCNISDYSTPHSNRLTGRPHITFGSNSSSEEHY